MGLNGTFDNFTAARLAIYVAQKGLSVTGNNIANINTNGYTRQRVDQVSLKTGGADRYHSQYALNVGQGVLASGISQIRDPYLDIRFRTEMASVGALDAKLAGLQDIAAVLDEVGKGTGEHEDDGLLHAAFSDFAEALRSLGENASAEDLEVLGRAEASHIVKLFNDYAKKLETQEKDAIELLKQDTDKVNEILHNIRELNEAIRKSDIYGDPALELRDDRNVLIDQLSEYMKIDVTYSMEDIGAGIEVEKLTIRLANANPDTDVTSDSAYLVDGLYATQLVMPENLAKENPDYDPNYKPADPDNLTAEDIKKTSKYLDKDGNPSNDPIPNDNYNFFLSKLVDRRGEDWEDISRVLRKLAQEPADPTASTTVDSVDSNAKVTKIISYEQDSKGQWYEVITTKKEPLQQEDFALDDNDLYGRLQADRELLTEEGEFTTTDTIKNVDENAAIKRGIPYYRKSLDLLAREFAKQYNQLNQGYATNQKGDYLTKDANGEYTKIAFEDGYLNKDSATWTAQQQAKLEDAGVITNIDADGKMTIDSEKLEEFFEDYLEKNGGEKMGGVLFSIRGDLNDSEGITAANISISKDWSSGEVHIIPTFIQLFDGEGEHTTKNDNLNHMISMLGNKLTFNPQDLIADADSSILFNGTFQEMLSNMCTVLGNDERSTSTLLDTAYSHATEIDTSRYNVSSVDLNDEAMNMMQYSKALNAAYRMMTTIDEALERLINNTGVVGR